MGGKYFTIGFIYIYLTIINLMATSLGVGVDSFFGLDLSGEGVTLNILRYIASFWALVTFQVDLPYLIILIFIYTPMLIMIYIILEIIKDVIPFT